MSDIPMAVLVPAIFGMVIVWIAVMIKPRLALIVIGAMLFLGTLGIGSWVKQALKVGWLWPIQTYRSELFLGCGLVLLLGLMGSLGKISIRRIGLPAWFLLGMGFLQGLYRMHHEGPQAGIVSMGFTAVTILPVALMLSTMLRRYEDWMALLRMIMATNAIYLGGCIVQAFLDPGNLSIGFDNRFFGLSAQPVAAAVFLGMSCIVGLWLILNETTWKYRSAWIVQAGINGILVLGSGSRVGLVLLVLGLTGILYRRVGWSVLLLPLAALSAGATMYGLSLLGIEFGFERVSSLQDTRTAVWLTLWENGLDNFWLGGGTGAHGGTVSVSENSFLYAFSSFGIGMAAITVLFLLASIYYSLKLRSLGRHYRAWQPMIDLTVTFFGLYFVDAMLSGILLARVEQELMFMLIFSASAGSFLTNHREGTLALPGSDESSLARDEWHDDVDEWDLQDYAPAQ